MNSFFHIYGAMDGLNPKIFVFRGSIWKLNFCHLPVPMLSDACPFED
jgi:hypothetical protein